MIDVREYVDEQGRSPYGNWFERLSAQAAAKVAVTVTRMSQGNLSNVKSVGEGVMERKIDWGPGYRVYFAWDGPAFIILLGGGSKKARTPTSRRPKRAGRAIANGSRTDQWR